MEYKNLGKWLVIMSVLFILVGTTAKVLYDNNQKEIAMAEFLAAGSPPTVSINGDIKVMEHYEYPVAEGKFLTKICYDFDIILTDPQNKFTIDDQVNLRFQVAGFMEENKGIETYLKMQANWSKDNKWCFDTSRIDAEEIDQLIFENAIKNVEQINNNLKQYADFDADIRVTPTESIVGIDYDSKTGNRKGG